VPGPGGSARRPSCAPADDPPARLTPQELQVVRLAAAGASNKQIGAQLFLSPRTVGFHLYRAFPKLGVTTREELAVCEPDMVGQLQLLAALRVSAASCRSRRQRSVRRGTSVTARATNAHPGALKPAM